METTQIITELKELIDWLTNLINRNNVMISEMELYLARWTNVETKDRFKKAIEIFMDHNKQAVEEKMECLQLLNEIEQDMYAHMSDAILKLR